MNTERLRAQLVAPHGPYAVVDVVASTGSTNADLAAAARAGAADRTVLVAGEQTAGQGRRARTWNSPPGAGVYLSVLLRPNGVPTARLSWLTLLAGVAAVRTARWAGAAEPALKWPNDLLLGAERGKAAGILAEVVGGGEPAVVLGVGLNVLPMPGTPPGAGGLPATSLAEAGAATLDRTELVAHLLTELADLDDAWRAAGGDPVASGLHDEYTVACGTLGERVRVELSDDEMVGTAVSVAEDGTLLVRTEDGTERPVSAGDVVHLRAEPTES